MQLLSVSVSGREVIFDVFGYFLMLKNAYLSNLDCVNSSLFLLFFLMLLAVAWLLGWLALFRWLGCRLSADVALFTGAMPDAPHQLWSK